VRLGARSVTSERRAALHVKRRPVFRLHRPPADPDGDYALYNSLMYAGCASSHLQITPRQATISNDSLPP